MVSNEMFGQGENFVSSGHCTLHPHETKAYFKGILALKGGDIVSEVKKAPTDQWTAIAEAYENKLRYPDFGKTLTVIYGDFEAFDTEKTDKKSGKKYPAKDYKVGTKVNGKRKVVRFNEWNFTQMIKKAQALAVENGGKFPETFEYTVPFPSGQYR